MIFLPALLHIVNVVAAIPILGENITSTSQNPTTATATTWEDFVTAPPAMTWWEGFVQFMQLLGMTVAFFVVFMFYLMGMSARGSGGGYSRGFANGVTYTALQAI